MNHEICIILSPARVGFWAKPEQNNVIRVVNINTVCSGLVDVEVAPVIDNKVVVIDWNPTVNGHIRVGVVVEGTNLIGRAILIRLLCLEVCRVE